MIFRDITNGNLLNICRTDYSNDRLFYLSIMHQAKAGISCCSNIVQNRCLINNKKDNNTMKLYSDAYDYTDIIPSWVNDIILLSHNNNA